MAVEVIVHAWESACHGKTSEYGTETVECVRVRCMFSWLLGRSSANGIQDTFDPGSSIQDPFSSADDVCGFPISILQLT